MRIVSLLPSATEIIDQLGLGAQLVGISHCCDHPADLMDRPIVTTSVIDAARSSAEIDQTVRDHLQESAALYALDTDLLDRLGPDLIVTQALCDVCAVNGEDVENCVSALGSAPGVVNLEPFSLDDVIQTVQQIGEATGAGNQAERLVTALRGRIDAVRKRTAAIEQRPTVAVIDWIDPPFIGGHWMQDLIDLAGGINAMPLGKAPSRTTSWSDIAAAQPDVVIVACCGFDLTRSGEEIRRSDALAELLKLAESGVEIHVCDGNGYFSRPGPRLVDSLEILGWILHPEVHGRPASVDGNYTPFASLVSN